MGEFPLLVAASIGFAAGCWSMVGVAWLYVRYLERRDAVQAMREIESEQAQVRG